MGKKVAIMQPYFLPYIGYWQLIRQVDEFVVYDNIKYTKKGWINRNRFLQNGKDAVFSLPLKSASDDLDIDKRELSETFEREKLVRQFREAYRKAPHFNENFPLIETIINFSENNLSCYVENSIQSVCKYLDISTPVIISSALPIEHRSLKGRDKVIAICKSLAATDYINPIGGLELYNKEEFGQEGVNLTFLKARALNYDTFGQFSIPHMSILDVLMFNSREKTKEYLNEFDLL